MVGYLKKALIYGHKLKGMLAFTLRRKSNRILGTKHLTLMRKFGTRSRPILNDWHRLFQA